MGINIYSRRYNWKPERSTPAINWGHPITRQLVGCYLLNEGTGTFHDLTGLRAPGTLTTATWSRNQAGIAVSFPGTSGQKGVVYSGGPILGGSKNLSIVAGITTTASASANGRAIYCERSNSGNDILKFEGLQSTLASNKLLMTYRNDAGTLMQAGQSVPIPINGGSFWNVAATKEGRNWKQYMQGFLVDTDTFGSSSDAFTDSGIECWIGGDKGDSASLWSGQISYLYLFKRCLSRAELQWLYVEPYVFIVQQSPARRYFYPSIPHPRRGDGFSPMTGF